MIDYYDHIDDYIAGKLDAEQEKAFEKAMAQDKELAMIVENYDVTLEVSSSLVELDVLNKLESWDEEGGESGKTDVEKRAIKKRNRMSTILISILGLFIVLFLLYQNFYSDKSQNQKNNTNPLYALGYEAPYDDGTLKSGSAEDIENLFARGKYYVSLNDWENAQSTLQEAISKTQDKDSLSAMHFWLAHVFLNTQSWQEAESEIDKISKPEQKNQIRTWLNKVE